MKDVKKTVPCKSGKVQKNAEKSAPAGIDLCGIKLTTLRKRFVSYYVTPGQPTFHNAMQAALAAGFKRSVAVSEIYNIIKTPDMQKIIKTNEALFFNELHESALKAIELKQRRAFFDPADYFEQKTVVRKTKKGEYEEDVVGLKPIQTLTPEQRMCIDGIDIKGQAGVPVYLMADRGRELNDIIKIDRELSKMADDSDDEETREIIMERITIREKRRAKIPQDVLCEIIEAPKG